MEIAPCFIHFVDMEGREITESTILSLLSSPNTHSDILITLVVRITVRDCISGVHHYEPSYSDRMQMIITDVQNCPFVQLPLCIRVNGEMVSSQSYIWNYLHDENVILRAMEVGSKLYSTLFMSRDREILRC